MTSRHTLARFLAIPAIAVGITLSTAVPSSADDNLLPIVQEVTGAAGNVTGIVESAVFELASTVRQILGAAG